MSVFAKEEPLLVPHQARLACAATLAAALTTIRTVQSGNGRLEEWVRKAETITAYERNVGEPPATDAGGPSSTQLVSGISSALSEVQVVEKDVVSGSDANNPAEEEFTDPVVSAGLDLFEELITTEYQQRVKKESSVTATSEEPVSEVSTDIAVDIPILEEHKSTHELENRSDLPVPTPLETSSKGESDEQTNNMLQQAEETAGQGGAVTDSEPQPELLEITDVSDAVIPLRVARPVKECSLINTPPFLGTAEHTTGDLCLHVELPPKILGPIPEYLHEEIRALAVNVELPAAQTEARIDTPSGEVMKGTPVDPASEPWQATLGPIPS